jgi:hypothetical protein
MKIWLGLHKYNSVYSQKQQDRSEKFRGASRTKVDRTGSINLNF